MIRTITKKEIDTTRKEAGFTEVDKKATVWENNENVVKIKKRISDSGDGPIWTDSTVVIGG